ncbi:hypothetical protein LZ31DRAFT_560923 [Colletotrichum somersetense]|nr:hypothetical protein LZ31DRAFT_560923 [Colletotrichum somersetense]
MHHIYRILQQTVAGHHVSLTRFALCIAIACLMGLGNPLDIGYREKHAKIYRVNQHS